MNTPDSVNRSPNLLSRGARHITDFVMWHTIDKFRVDEVARRLVAEEDRLQLPGYPRTKIDGATLEIHEYDGRGVEINHYTREPIDQTVPPTPPPQTK